MGLILALDFGGTKLTAALFDAGSNIMLNCERQFSPVKATANSDLKIMRSLIHSVLQGEKPTVIGVSFGGPVDATTGAVRLSHHVLGWENTPLGKILEKEFNVPVYVDNDANVAALGEYRFGAGQGYDSLFYITVSTGVGGGWILKGQPWQGAEGMAGEIGHMVVDPSGPICLCGKLGCVERLASGPYIAQDVRDVLRNKSQGNQTKRGEILRNLVKDDLDLITAKVVSEAATAGDELAWEFLSRAGWALGVGIGNVANLMNPQRFILGGGVTKAGKRFWEVTRQVARATALPEVHFDIVPATLGDDAPLWGAYVLAVNALIRNS